MDTSPGFVGQTPAVSQEEPAGNWIARLRGFAGKAQRVPARCEPSERPERCERCGCAIGTGHCHLIEPATRRVVCACPACAAQAELDPADPYRRVPDRVRLLADFRISADDWDALGIPIGLAFFFRSRSVVAGGSDPSLAPVVAMYPGAAGAIESHPDLAAWQALVSANPVLESLLPDVEALLAYRLGGAHRYYLVPIDRCYALSGLTRVQWRGISGGAAVWESIEDFFAELYSEANRAEWTESHA